MHMVLLIVAGVIFSADLGGNVRERCALEWQEVTSSNCDLEGSYSIRLHLNPWSTLINRISSKQHKSYYE